ncbi:MAG: hypothetical protein ACREEM_31640, partial [Blastocatellia bacterium]
AKDHVNGSRNFKEHIGKLLLENPSAEFVEGTVAAVRNRNLDLGTFYSLCINRLDDEEFRKKENSILEQRMGKDSYQRYRTELFFDHVIAYALLQACALVAERKLSLASGVKLILSGNGWGLMVFGEMARDGKDFKKRCQQILEDIIRQIQSGYQTRPETEETKKELECLERLKVFDVVLLNQSNLSEAKTAVAIGALAKVDEDGKQNDDEVTAPCLGLTLPAVSFNGGPNVELRWCDRWQAEFIKKKAGLRYNDSLDHLQIEEPENPESPLDHTLTVFSLLGGRRGTLPPEEWLNLNNRLCKGKAYLDDNRLGLAPINYFLSKLLYPDPEEGRDIYLNKLAEISGTLK